MLVQLGAKARRKRPPKSSLWPVLLRQNEKIKREMPVARF